MSKEIVICAAVKYEDQIFRGHRHSDAIGTMNQKLSYNMTRKQLYRIECKEGFITSKNRFVDRKEGYDIQIAAGIKTMKNYPYSLDMLYSENLY